MVAAHIQSTPHSDLLPVVLPDAVERLVKRAAMVGPLKVDYARFGKAIGANQYRKAANILELTLKQKGAIIAERMGLAALERSQVLLRKLRFLDRMLQNGFPPSAAQLEEFWRADALKL